MSEAEELRARAAAPATTGAELQQLARFHPELRPVIAANPATYDALLEWLAGLGDPEIDAALAARTQAEPEAAPEAQPESESAPQPVAEVEPAPQPEPAPQSEPETALVAEPAAVAAPAAQPEPEPAPVPQPTQVLPPAYAPQATPSAQPLPAAQPTLVQPAFQPATPSAPVYQPGATQPLTSATLPEAAPASPEHRRSHVWLWVVAAIALVAVVALVTTFVLLGRSKAEDVASARATTGTTAAATSAPTTSTPATSAPSSKPSPTPAPSPTPSPTRLSVAYPAPSGALEMNAFAAPSGNIGCQLGADSVTCIINEHTFVPTGNGCEASPDGPYAVTLAADGTVTTDCTGGFTAPGASLGYGSAAKNDAFACTSDQSGIDCWSQTTGEGIKLSREDALITSR